MLIKILGSELLSAKAVTYFVERFVSLRLHK